MVVRREKLLRNDRRATEGRRPAGICGSGHEDMVQNGYVSQKHDVQPFFILGFGRCDAFIPEHERLGLEYRSSRTYTANCIRFQL